MRDIADAMNYIEEQVGSEAKIINGYVDEPQVGGEIRVTVIVTGFKRVEPGFEQQAPSPSGRKDSSSPKPPPAQSFGGRPAHPGVMAPEPVKEDMRIPAYIRRSRSIKEPFDIGRTGEPAGGQNPFTSEAGENEQIRKGSTDTPAYLRRKNNSPLP